MSDCHHLRCTSTQYTTAHARVAKPDDLIGKTISAVARVYGHTIGLAFTDGTYFYAEATEGDWEGEPTFDKSYKLPEASEALQMGIIDQAEYDRCLAEQVADREKYEKAEFERLRAKFEGAGEPKP